MTEQRPSESEASTNGPLSRAHPAKTDLCPTEPIDITEIVRLLGERS
ncbi:hypothetical protein [Frondihabitans sp. PAMC 28766]|nr:hypothetical protein [Frondihabitans sp. PAMC 28766]